MPEEIKKLREELREMGTQLQVLQERIDSLEPEEIRRQNTELQKSKERIELLETLVFAFFRTNKYKFSKNIEMQDGRNIEVNTGTGTRIGTATGQKLSVYGVTPVVQAGAISAPSGGATVDAEARTAINSIRTALTNFGITA